MNNGAYKMIYQDALLNLSSGRVDDITREVLSYAPLPPNYVDPFAAQATDANAVMEMTGKAMSAWIEEARKANYFSKHFIQLSKMIMNGTVTMARGLVSLRNRGEDPAQAPMSIGDLIDLGSYHFRKSYLGVIQTVKSHPEISERLLMNQLGWANTLLRLFKTKEKLERPLVSKPAPDQIEITGRESLDAPSQECLQSGPKEIKAFEEKAYSDISAVFEPGVYSAPRAYRSLDGTPEPKARKRIPAAAHAESRPAKPENAPETGTEKTLTGEKPDGTLPEKETPAGNPEKRPEPGKAGEAEPEKETPESGCETPAAGNPGKQSPVPQETAERDKGSGDGIPPEINPGNTGPAPGDIEIPPWVRIMERVFQNEVPEGEDRSITFTEDEARLLLAEPEFWSYFPDIAAALRCSLPAVK